MHPDTKRANECGHEALPGFMGLIGDHPSMRRIFEIIRRVGPSDAPVLVTGDSGSGKELVARALHQLSNRATRSFVPVHCGAIPEDLLESELFGHVKGAFTGAVAARTGRFQLANHGTIFLDEIGEMSARFQVKLLRVLEDGTFDPVGSATSRHADVRVVAATHRDLHASARSGGFREDLLYRLDVVRVHLPSLRDRREDIPLIARHFLAQSALRDERPEVELPGETAAALMAYDWPGNVRELRNVLERAVLLSEQPEVLLPSDLPAPIGSSADAGSFRPVPRAEATPVAGPWDFGPEGTDFYHELETFERRMIGRALQLAGGSKREAARLLQVNRTTLLEKLKRRGWQVGPGELVEQAPTPPAAPAPAAPVPGAPMVLQAQVAPPTGLPMMNPVVPSPLPLGEPVLPVPALPWPGSESWLDLRRPVARAFPAAPATAAVAQRAAQLP